MIKKTNVVADSQLLTTIMSCARLADFRFNHNLQSINGKSKSLEMGSICHVVLENYFKLLIAGKFRSTAIDEALQAGRDYILTEEVKNSSLQEREHALNTMEQYFEFYKADHWVPLEVEVVKGSILYEDDDIRILYKAKFDLIVDTNQGIFPVDHKTMSQRRETLDLNNQFMGQCILSSSSRMVVNKIGFQTSLPAKEKFTRALIPYSTDRLAEFQNEILPFYIKMWLGYNEEQFFPPNFTHCENKYGFCQFKDVCKSNRNMRQAELQSGFMIGKPWDVSNLVVEK